MSSLQSPLNPGESNIDKRNIFNRSAYEEHKEVYDGPHTQQ